MLSSVNNLNAQMHNIQLMQPVEIFSDSHWQKAVVQHQRKITSSSAVQHSFNSSTISAYCTPNALHYSTVNLAELYKVLNLADNWACCVFFVLNVKYPSLVPSIIFLNIKKHICIPTLSKSWTFLDDFQTNVVSVLCLLLCHLWIVTSMDAE